MALAVANRSGKGVTRARVLDDAASGRQAFWGGAVAFTGSLKRSVLADPEPSPDSYQVVERLWDEAERLRPGADLLQKMTYVELKQRLAELLLMRVDKMTMATSVEARVPFLDHELVEFALALPERLKVRGGIGKLILKQAVSPLLPPEIARRPKQGFTPPLGQWLRGPLGERAQHETASSTLRERGLFDYDRIDRLWESHRRGLGDWSFQLWTLWNVSAWHDYWIAGRAASPPPRVVASAGAASR
jgi:asparagine synthase (glutamine-hydrolysing)